MQENNSISKKIFLILLTVFIPILFSCREEDYTKIPLGHNFYYWEASADSTPGEAMQNLHNFRKLEDLSEHNLMHVFGKDRHFVWIRADFEIPPPLKGQPLGMVIPHLRFAEQVYCNGNFISQYGAFPPNEQSTLFKAHFFSFPLNVLKQEGKNTVLIKVFSMGDSGISSHSYICAARYAYPAFERINFNHTRIYIFFFGMIFFTFVLYFCFYISLPNFKEYLTFAILNFISLFCISYFFATEIPAYTNGKISHLLFAKLTLCIPGYLIVYISALFASHYYGKKPPFFVTVTRHAIITIQIIPTVFASSYDFLLKISPAMVSILLIQLALILFEMISNLIGKETRRNAIHVMTGFLPFILGCIIDVIIRTYDNTQAYPYFLIYGWQGSIICFIIFLSRRFGIIYRNNERLSDHLLDEVALRTHELADANYELSVLNEKLEKDKLRSDMELEMASVVQRKFLPKTNKLFKGWEIAICYAPHSKVSGDFYDYYSYNNSLNGITLFDVSGHGLSASLVTMLSKNIISRIFQTGYKRKESVDKLLNKINALILAEKGDIENYMTGILCRFDNTENSAKCSVELGNAGHPYPLKYSIQENEVFEIKSNDGKQHYGAIGMKGIAVSFARSNFLMSTGDILVFYTDGLTEASNSKQEQFGVNYMKSILKEYHTKPPVEILGIIMQKLDDFTEYRGFEDDLTVIIAKKCNPAEFVAEDEIDDFSDNNIEELHTPED